jgi:hypothetical protein
LRVRSLRRKRRAFDDDTLCLDNGGGSGLGYSRSIWPAQLGGPFHFCDWIGLTAPAVRLSDQSRVKCTLPRQRLCDCIYTQLSSECQGARCTTPYRPDSCTRKITEKNKGAAALRLSGPYRPIQLTLVRCRLAFCHSPHHYSSRECQPSKCGRRESGLI